MRAEGDSSLPEDGPDVPTVGATCADSVIGNLRRSDLLHFFGRKGHVWVSRYRAMVQKNGRFGHNLNGWVLLFGPCWFLYRRMYAVAAGYLLFAILVQSVLGDEYYVSLSIAIFGALLANRAYFARARRVIAAADARGLVGPPRQQFLEGRGGTTMLGLIFGILLLLIGAVTVFLQRAGLDF